MIQFMFVFTVLSFGMLGNDKPPSLTSNELPQDYEVPLPEECIVPGTNTHSYNQGQCSRSPCTSSHLPCANSLQCCYEIDQTSSIEFICSHSSTRLRATVILSCSCQVCDKLRTHIQGRVLSSLELQPVVLAAIMIETEVATFTDENGYFSFDLSTGNGDISLLFQETHHRMLRTNVNIRHSTSPEVNVVMERIQNTVTIETVHLGADASLKNDKMENVLVEMAIRPRSLVEQATQTIYEGSGQLMYSLYDANNKPEFTSEALNQMVFTDSKGVEFSLQSYVICSMEIVSESGHLSLRKGSPLNLRVTLNFDVNIDGTQISNFHLFVYSVSQSRWTDKGKVGVNKIQKSDHGYGTIVTVQQVLHDVNLLWVIGRPVRITCYIKAMVTSEYTRKEVLDATLSLIQSDTTPSTPTYYQYSSMTSAGVGVCLKAVCALGGTVRVLVSKDDRITAVPPSVDVGMVMGDKEQIVFYNTGEENAQTPYYQSESECQSSDKQYFEFTSNQTVQQTFIQPVRLPLIKQQHLTTPLLTQKDFCFAKVSVYDCAPLTEIKVLSYSTFDHSRLLSMHTAVATGASNKNTCQSAEVVSVRASCVQFTCGSDAHVTIQSQNHYATYSLESVLEKKRSGHYVHCRYWSSNRNIPSNQHPSENMKSFHLNDVNSLPPSSGVYRSSNIQLALLQCMSGNVEVPASVMDPESGVAVTFTCLY